MNKILITGAAGFIGYHLSKRLLQEGFSIFGLDNINDYYDPDLKKARLTNLKAELVEATPRDTFDFRQVDLQDFQGLQKVFSDFNPDLVINLAAQAAFVILWKILDHTLNQILMGSSISLKLLGSTA